MADTVSTLPERSVKVENASLLSTRECAIQALTRLYEILIKLSYIPPEALMIPPEAGFEGIDEDELRQRGKNETVIDTLRHLPYLDQTKHHNNWTVAEGTLHINYAQGNLYYKWLEDDILPCPGHTIWLSHNTEKYGSDWLLDTETWEIIEITIMGSSVEWDYETYENTPKEDRWKAYSRMPAASFFDLLRYKYETLEFFIIRDPHSFEGTARCFEKDPQHLWEDSLLSSDDEETDGDFEQDSSVESDSSSTDGEDGDWEVLEDVNELEWLRSDVEEIPFPGWAGRDVRSDVEAEKDPLKGCSRCSLFCNGRTLEIQRPDVEHWNRPHDIKRRQLIRELEGIYHENGWPRKKPSQTMSSYRVFRHPGDELDLTAFNRQACGEDLRNWMETVRRKEHEEMERVQNEENSKAMQEVIGFRHRLQRLLLSSNVEPGEGELMQAADILDEIRSFSFPIDRTHLTKSKLDKVLKAILASALLKEGNDCGVTERCKAILDDWKGLEE